ncbi:MAG: HD-GYP domain-containing protein, partial [Rhodocyclaceae bacterium]
AEILSKPTSLLAAEFEIIKAHPENGAAILSPIAFPWPVAEIIRQHHERMDGSGYPRGLRGDELLLESRILAIADVVEAMASHRPYRPAHALLDTLQFITRQRGILFDPMVVDACMHLLIQERYALTEGSDKNNPVAGKK